MSLFYGTVEGQRGPATRCGTSSSGIRAAAQSWNGSVIVRLRYANNTEGPLIVSVSTSDGSSAYGSSLWEGSFDEFKRLLERDMEVRRFKTRY